MTKAVAGPHQVLVVHSDARVRAALAEVINATDGFVVVGAVGSVDALERQPLRGIAAEPTVALVGIESARPDVGLTGIRALTDRVRVVAVATAASLEQSVTAAGASAFCETDGDPEAVLRALQTACRPPG